MSEGSKIKIELTGPAKKIVANLQTLPPKMVQAIADGMKLGSQMALAKVKQRLVGVGPFPPEQHKLGRRSGSLYSGVRASDPVVNGAAVDSTIGTNVTNNGFSYAALHEFGGRVVHKPRPVKLRTREDLSLVSQLQNLSLVKQRKLSEQQRARLARLAVFAKKSDPNSKTVMGKGWTKEMPARAPFRTGIGEAMPSYKRNISAGIVAAWNDLKN